MVRNLDILHLVCFLLFRLNSVTDECCFVGGSTIVLLFEKGAVTWDEDLLVNGRASLETLVRVGMGIGVGARRPTS